MEVDKPVYLGDGVYVNYDGYQLWLLANSHENPTDKVALDPDVARALVATIEECKRDGLL